MSNQQTEKFNEAVLEAEEEIKDAEEEREKAIEEICQAIKWYQRCEAKVNLEKINLSVLKQKDI